MHDGFGCCLSVVIYVVLVVYFTPGGSSIEFMEDGHIHAPRFCKDMRFRSLDATKRVFCSPMTGPSIKTNDI